MRIDQVLLQPDEIDFGHYLAETEAQEKVRSASQYLDQVMHALAPAHENPDCAKLPFANAWLFFQPGEVTIWGGFNGSGKSMLQGQVMADFADKGQRICIASFEMKPARTLARIAKQVIGPQPSKTQVQAWMDKMEGRLWLYDQQGTVKPERMIAVIKHCAEKLKCQHIVIDSLMKCVKGDDDYNGQKNFVDQLTVCARDLNVHIHLVAHLRKGDEKGDERMPSRMDLKGTAAVSDLVDQVILVWRNKTKERARDSGKVVSDTDPDSVLVVDKNRNGEWEGRVKLWFDIKTMRFSDFNRDSRRGLARELNREAA